MSKISRIGIYLSKSVFVLYGVDTSQQCCLEWTLNRAANLSFFTNIEPCRVAMESSPEAHYWARELSKLGHDAKKCLSFGRKPRHYDGHWFLIIGMIGQTIFYKFPRPGKIEFFCVSPKRPFRRASE